MRDRKPLIQKQRDEDIGPKTMSITKDGTTSDKYRSIASPVEGLFKDSGSRFLAYAYPVSSVSQVKPLLDALRKEHHAARHHCYAYRIGHLGQLERQSDDGEPSGTAGPQILRQLTSRDLSDTLVVVVRYFGGIKLGIPGLIRAYRSSTDDALDHAVITEKTAGVSLSVEFDYLAMNDVMKVLKDPAIEILDRSYADRCRVGAFVPLSMQKAVSERLSDAGAVVSVDIPLE